MWATKTGGGAKIVLGFSNIFFVIGTFVSIILRLIVIPVLSSVNVVEGSLAETKVIVSLGFTDEVIEFAVVEDGRRAGAGAAVIDVDEEIPEDTLATVAVEDGVTDVEAAIADVTEDTAADVVAITAAKDWRIDVVAAIADVVEDTVADVVAKAAVVVNEESAVEAFTVV